jgi:AcrR family transcriptional regulator
LPSSLKERLKQVKREAILNEASVLFNDVGYEQMKIADLAKNVGVSVGTVYTMFGSKENLFNNCILQEIREAAEKLEEAIQSCSDPVERLRAILAIKFTAITKNRKALEASVVHDPTFFFAHDGEEDSPMRILQDYIAEEVMVPLLNGRSDREPLELVYLLDGLSIGMIKYWMVADGDLMERVDETVDLFLKIVKESE